MRVLDLFSGIGGMSLGLERAGMTTVGFCEIDPFCRAVLKKHWPDVWCHDDVRTLDLREGVADVVAGGFPCQDISNAGKHAGLAGQRSGLWSELLRTIRVVRPQFAIVENVAALLGRGMGTVLGDLAAIGYDAEWDCVSACSLGAPHARERVFLVAHANSGRRCASWSREVEAAPTDCVITSDQFAAAASGITYWANEPGVPRVVDGVPNLVDRSIALGNSLVPQIPDLIGRAIMSAAQP